MNRIKKTGESINRKLSEETVRQQDSKTVEQKDSKALDNKDGKPERQQDGKKKVTFYISLQVERKLNEIYTKKMMQNNKEDKSSLISRAIDLLWKEEKNYDL